MFAGFMALQPVIRYGILAGVIVAAIGSIWFHGYVKGRNDMKEKWDAAIAEQAAKSAHQTIQQTTSSQGTLETLADQQRKTYEQIKIVERKIYVPAEDKPCVLGPGTVEQFDAVSSLLPSKERVSAPDPSAGEPVDAPEAGPTAFEAVQAYYHAVEQLTWLWLDYSALVEWERNRYAIEKAGFEGSQK